MENDNESNFCLDCYNTSTPSICCFGTRRRNSLPPDSHWGRRYSHINANSSPYRNGHCYTNKHTYTDKYTYTHQYAITE